MNEPNYHKSVMEKEAVGLLHVKNQALYIDGTLGTGGHSLEILKSGGKVLGIDMDPVMVRIADSRLSMDYGNENYKLITGNFTDIKTIAEKNNWMPVSGIILDLGVSNLHLKNEERGFSFENTSAPLDMRLNKDTQGVTAADLLNVLREDQLNNLFKSVMEASPSRWLTKRVIEFRNGQKIETVGDFLSICSGLKSGKSGLSEATLPFLALRIAVNSELDNLSVLLPAAYEVLKPGGRLVVMTFHSGEDRIVKNFEKKVGGGGTFATPSSAEIYNNPRARSAKVRVIIK